MGEAGGISNHKPLVVESLQCCPSYSSLHQRCVSLSLYWVSLSNRDVEVDSPRDLAAQISCVDGGNTSSSGSPVSKDVRRETLSGPLCLNPKLDGTDPDVGVCS
ncbi:hypothetical protein MRX96_036480 [Rhipicephalus microplus]